MTKVNASNERLKFVVVDVSWLNVAFNRFSVIS